MRTIHGFYRGITSEVTRVDMLKNLVTSIDSPFYRWSEGPDVAQLRLKEVVLPGLIVEASKRGAVSFPARTFAFME